MYASFSRCAVLLAVLIGLTGRVFAGVPASSDIRPTVPVIYNIMNVQNGWSAPITPLAAWLGLQVSMEPNGTITIARGEKRFACAVGMSTATRDGKVIALPFAPFEHRGEVFIPLQPLLEMLGGTVESNPELGRYQAFVTLPETGKVTVGMYGAKLPFMPYGYTHDLYLVPLDGSPERRMNYEQDLMQYSPRISADGKLMAYSCIIDGKIVVRSTTDTSFHIIKLPVENAFCRKIYFTPDNTALICEVSGKDPWFQIVRMKLDGSDMRVLRPGNNLRMSPDGSMIAANKENTANIVITDLEGGNPRTLDAAGTPVAFSPDSTRLLVKTSGTAPDGKETYGLAVYVLSGQQQGMRYELPLDNPVLNAAFSPDSRQIVYTCSNQGVWEMQADCTGAHTLINDATINYAAYTPDGQQLIVLTSDDRIYQVNLDGSKRTALASKEFTRIFMLDYTPDGKALLAVMLPNSVWFPCSPPDVIMVNGVPMAPYEPLIKLFGIQHNAIEMSKNTISVYPEGASRSALDITVGSMEAKKREQNSTTYTTITLPSAPVRVNGVVYGPLESLVTAIGGKYSVDAARGRVTVTSEYHGKPVTVELPIVTAPSVPAAWNAQNRTEIYAVYTNGVNPCRLTYDTEANPLPTFTADESAYSYICHGQPVLRKIHYTVTPLMPADDALLACDPTVMLQPGYHSVIWPRPRLLTPASSSLQPRRISLPLLLKTQIISVRGDSLLIKDRGQQHSRKLVTGGVIEKPSFTPDGKRIVFLADHTLSAINPDGSEKTNLAHGLTVTDYTLSPSGVVYFLAEPPAGGA